jgi:hypothetical protein
MSQQVMDNYEKLQESVNASLRKAEEIVAGIQKNNTILTVSTIISSAGATLVAGIAATVGPGINMGADGWRITCIIAAGFGLVSTVSTGIGQQLKVSDRLSESKQGLARLRYLSVVMATGSDSWDEIASEYEEIAKAYPELIV